MVFLPVRNSEHSEKKARNEVKERRKIQSKGKILTTPLLILWVI
jgi:hypothetical protein